MTDTKYPLPLTEKQRSDICAVLGMGCSRATAAKRVGIPESVLYREMERYPEFEAEMRLAESSYELRHMKNVFDAAADPKNWRVSVWALEHVLPERYARRDPSRVSPDQFQRFLNALLDIVIEEVPEKEHQDKIRHCVTQLLDEVTHRRTHRENRCRG